MVIYKKINFLNIRNIYIIYMYSNFGMNNNENIIGGSLEKEIGKYIKTGSIKSTKPKKNR